MISDLKNEEEKLEKKIELLNDEYAVLGTTFCEQAVSVNIKVRWQKNFIPFDFFDFFDLSAFSDSHLSPSSFIYKRIYELYKDAYSHTAGIKRDIEQASEQSTNLRLKETAQKMLDNRQELINTIKTLNEVKKKNLQELERICSLFGHEIKQRPDCWFDFDFRGRCLKFECKCCGKAIRREEYIKVHSEAKYKGVVTYYCCDCYDSK